MQVPPLRIKPGGTGLSKGLIEGILVVVDEARVVTTPVLAEAEMREKPAVLARLKALDSSALREDTHAETHEVPDSHYRVIPIGGGGGHCPHEGVK